ncbi:hypothetical protein HN873_060757 [Arachis hypogaea]
MRRSNTYISCNTFGLATRAEAINPSFDPSAGTPAAVTQNTSQCRPAHHRPCPLRFACTKIVSQQPHTFSLSLSTRHRTYRPHRKPPPPIAPLFEMQRYSCAIYLQKESTLHLVLRLGRNHDQSEDSNRKRN